MLIRILVFVLSVVVFASLANADSNRMNRRWSIMMGTSDPMPTFGGLNVSYQITDFMQVQIGGGYDDVSSSEGPASEVGTATAAAFFWIILLGQVDYQEIKDFLNEASLENGQVVTRTVTALAGGLNFTVPGWEFSPLAGVYLGNWNAKNSPFGLTNYGNHAYMKLGVDYQGEKPWRFGLGWAYAPAMPEVIEHRLYGYLGISF